VLGGRAGDHPQDLAASQGFGFLEPVVFIRTLTQTNPPYINLKTRNPNIESGPADRNKPHKGKFEIRSSKSETNRSQLNLKLGKSKTLNSTRPVWSIAVVFHHFEFVSNFGFRALLLDHLNLFRISKFVLRNFPALLTLYLLPEII
jgi:hypothetical protein